ncbi:hypothetical protein P0136_10045 [Lentisphaerota bacterium ZTH]|nr:hypothetical protein JYG24_12440 [Lentisphaerota bacterium]WET05703.1 hypothetical protein P0136_10045 [Lentisphaerota bacterium ZTH]
MNILLDTNILIPLEDTRRPLDPQFAEMRRLSSVNGHNLFIHPSQIDDILRDQNEERKKIVLSRLSQYQMIAAPPCLTPQDLDNYGWSQNNDNDRVDNLLLHALCRGAVNLLVTNDRKIQSKAKRTGVQEQVHRLDQFLVYLKNQAKPDSNTPYGIQERWLYEFDLKQPFFNSLRSGYDSFDEWYLTASTLQRKAWCVTGNNDDLYAMCIYKEERNPKIIDNGSPVEGKVLKLCTLKVGLPARGRKLGERLLYTAFKYAVENNFDWIYLHTFGAEHEMLVALCEEYGFRYEGRYNSNEDVFLKPMKVPTTKIELAPLDFAIQYYPHYLDRANVKKYIIPIQKQYHNDLFADISDMASGLFANDQYMYNPQGNTIKKAYICHAVIKKIKPGDILLFYRTKDKDRQSIECVGIVEQTFKEVDINKVLPIVSKRTVFSKKELEKILKKETLIILFRHLKYITPIPIEKLEALGVKGPIQSIREISHEIYGKLL